MPRAAGKIHQIIFVHRGRDWDVGLQFPPFYRFDEVAHLLNAADKAFAQQLVIGCLHGDFADLQILRQRAFGGQFFPGSQLAAENIRPDAPVQCLIQRHPRCLFQFISQHTLTPRID